LKSLVADFEVKENLSGLCRARHDDRLWRMEHQRQRDVASRLFLRQVASQHVDAPPSDRDSPQAPQCGAEKQGRGDVQLIGPVVMLIGPVVMSVARPQR
jgi:hypothetical protein